MKAIHTLSHNAVLVQDKEGKNCVVIGKGVGFRKEKGDLINISLVQKVFVEDCQYKKKVLVV